MNTCVSEARWKNENARPPLPEAQMFACFYAQSVAFVEVLGDAALLE